MLLECFCLGFFGVFLFFVFFPKCMRNILLCRKPEVIFGLFFALQDCEAYFVSFALFFFCVCVLFSQKEGLVASMRE